MNVGELEVSMRTIRLILLGLFPVLAIAALMVLAQRLAVEAYWEVHPEAKLEAEVRRPAVEKAISSLRERRRQETQQAVALEKALEPFGLAKSQQQTSPSPTGTSPIQADSRN